MKSKSIVGLSVSRWPSSLGRIGSEYATVYDQPPRLLIWIRQSADSDKRERLANQFRRTHAHLERLTVRSLSTVFQPLTAKILDRFEQAGTVAVQVEELFHQAELATPFNHVMSPVWMRSAEAGIHFEADWVGAVKPQFYVPSNVQRDVKSIDVDMSAGLQRAVRDWLKERTDGVWAEIAKTIHKRLETTLKTGLRDGLTLKEMTANIQTTLKGIEEYQAKRIARTETTGGMNFGGQAERTDLGIEHKEWVSTIDFRTRGAGRKDRYDHISANGQIVNNSDPFNVSGQKLLYPADGSHGASAANICNCRCCSVGAWPNSPLKPSTSGVVVPSPKPSGWVEPRYEKATLPTSPMPSRKSPDPIKHPKLYEEHLQLQKMDAEQRSTETIDRINALRDKLTANNDTLETIRHRFLNREAESEKLGQTIKELRDEYHELFRSKQPSNVKMAETAKKLEDAKSALEAWKQKQWSRTVEDIATQSKADVVASLREKTDRNVAAKAKEAAAKLAQILSDKHGNTLHINAADMTGENTNRAFYRPSTKTYHTDPTSSFFTHFHEIGHRIEDSSDKKVENLLKGFLHHRGGMEKAGRILGLVGEVGIEDEFKKAFAADGPYCGKYYGFGATEILSMGMQQLYQDPVSFAKNDPEYFKLIIGILRGDLL